MDQFPHSLIVYCHKELTPKQKKYLEKHFSLKKHSNGGPCEVSRLSPTQFKISYMKEKDMQNVLEKKNHEIKIDGETIWFRLQLDEQTEQENLAMPILEEEGATAANIETESNELNVGTESNVQRETNRPSKKSPNKEITSTSIIIDSISQYEAISDIIKADLDSLGGLHVIPEEHEIQLYGNPADLKKAREIIKNAIRSLHRRPVQISENIRKFLESWGKKDISEKLFGRATVGGCVVLDASRELYLYSTSKILLDQAEMDLHGLVEEVLNVRAEEHCINVLEKIKKNKNIFCCQQEIKSTNHWVFSLSGFKKDVEEAMKDLSQHTIIHEKFHLRDPVLAQNLLDILKAFNLCRYNVAERILQTSANDVTLTGSKEEVNSFKRILKDFQKKYYHQQLCISKPGARQFFSTKMIRLFQEMFSQYNCKVHLIREFEISIPALEEDENRISEGSSPNKPPPILLILIDGNLEEQKADIIATPLLATNPSLSALNVTKALQSVAGPMFSQLFLTLLNGRTVQSGVIDMDVSGDNYKLQCQTMIFIPCNPWTGPNHLPVQELRKGIAACLDKCKDKNACSLAMPAVGTGFALKFPYEQAAKILGEEVKTYVEREPNTCLREIKIVIPSGNRKLFDVYRDTLMDINLGNRIVLCNEDRGCFLIPKLGDMIQVKAGNMSLSLVYDDIVNEKTDAVVNSTNFKSWRGQSVAHAIFTKAGPSVIKSAQEACGSQDKPVMTGPGNMNCKYIFHINCNGNLESLKKLLKDVILKCEEIGLKSVTFPAIGTGDAGLQPQVVARYMLETITSLALKNRLTCLSCVRLVVVRPHIYSIFCSLLKEQFEPSWCPWDIVSARLKNRHVPNAPVEQDIKEFVHPVPPHPAALLSIVGPQKENVEAVKCILKGEFDKYYTAKKIKNPSLKSLSLEEIQVLFSAINNNTEVQMKLDIKAGCINMCGGKMQVGETFVQVKIMLEDILNKRKDKAKREEAGLLVQWAYDNGAAMELFSEEASQELEDKYLSKSMCVTVTVENDIEAKLNLDTMQASLEGVNREVTVQRWDLTSEIGLPVKWENMYDCFLLLVGLDPSSVEYKEVQINFNRTAKHLQILKIERIQNKYLYTSYMLMKKFMKKKNGAAAVNEHKLYRSAAHQDCPSINFHGFNSNATAYGTGLDFTVNSEDSARPTYPIEGTDSQQQFMYQAKVLVGHYTKGEANLKAPPQRAANTHHQYDSVADNVKNPKTFIVFNNYQVYPEYLITFLH
ncbi:protein mono-ADP-ribosyltransferase PARP14-like isoform 1-T1 [Discoglossus pictus]